LAVDGEKWRSRQDRHFFDQRLNLSVVAPSNCMQCLFKVWQNEANCGVRITMRIRLYHSKASLLQHTRDEIKLRVGSSTARIVAGCIAFIGGASMSRLCLLVTHISSASFHTMNIATAAANMTRITSMTMRRPSNELGCRFMILESQATSNIPTNRNGANTPLTTAVQ
jgi:hypothetical protein